MENKFKRFLSLAVAIVLVLSCVPVNAFAQDKTTACSHVFENSVCNLCGETETVDEQPTEASETVCSHVYGEPVVTEATCAVAGKSVYTCTVEGCGYSYEEEIAATEKHVYENGACTTCGAAEPVPVSNENTVPAVQIGEQG